MYGRFDYYGAPDVDREMYEARSATRYELVYQTGGTGGPYPDETKAKAAAERLLKGGKDRWIAVIDSKGVSDLKRAKVLWLLKRSGGWEKGPRPLPNVPPREHYGETVGWLDEARGSRMISFGDTMNLKRDPKAGQMALRPAPGGAFGGYEVKTFPSREKMIDFLKKASRHPSHGALGRKEWKALIKDKVAKNMTAYPSYQEEQLAPSEARSTAVRKAFAKEEVEDEIERLESTSSPFPEVRARRIEELRAELEEAAALPGHLKKKWSAMKKGERVVISDGELDQLSAHFKGQDTKEADLFFMKSVTVPNPKRVGVKDKYVGYIKR